MDNKLNARSNWGEVLKKMLLYFVVFDICMLIL